MDAQRLRKLNELYEAFAILADGSYVYLCDIKEDYSRWSKAAVDFFDLPGEYMYHAGDIWEEHIHPEDRSSYHASIARIFSGEDRGHDMQYRAAARDGSYAMCTCRGVVLFDEDGQPNYFGGAIKNHELLSYIDTVTGLRSLYGFFDDLRSMCWREKSATVLLIGINQFSNVNDIYGYTFGNSVLQKVGKILRTEFSNAGLLYRMDGTKFALISSDTPIETLTEIYKRVQNILSHEFFVKGERVSLSLNAGAVVLESFHISMETVYSCLKYAYYESKDTKLGDMVIFANRLSDENRLLLEKLNVIRNSVSDECDGFYLCYQPIVDAATEQLKGMEALLRWHNDYYGSVPPIQFIPVLEQDPLFPDLGKWILRRAMEDTLPLLGKYPDLVVNVNLSYAQLEKSDFVASVLNLLEDTGLPPRNLCLEITERCRLLDTVILKNMCRVFREHGIRIALDDFGTGFSSLGILRELPVDIIKIDRMFVKDLVRNVSDQQTIQVISGLADAFSADVCVEGVETEDIRDFLRRYHITSFQGYLYSMPLTIFDFREKYVPETL
ncbi:MAG: GGDEF and EAL domain-containing protein [Oscillospiraceae bacterium]|nr:GGDEF and EAL domain-containing protein [Oscillospiraceae bacterium]